MNLNYSNFRKGFFVDFRVSLFFVIFVSRSYFSLWYSYPLPMDISSYSRIQFAKLTCRSWLQKPCCTSKVGKANTSNLVEIAIEFYKANTEIPGVGNIRGRSCKNNSKESKGEQSIWSFYGPWCKLPRFAHCLIILMQSQICPCFPVERSLKCVV